MKRILLLLIALPACDLETGGTTTPDLTPRGVQVGSEGILEPSCVARGDDNTTPTGGFQSSADDLALQLSGERRVQVGPELDGIMDVQLVPIGYVTPDESCAESLVFSLTARFDLGPSLEAQPIGFASMGTNGVLQFEAVTDAFEADPPPEFDEELAIDLVYSGTITSADLGELVFRGCVDDRCEEQTIGAVEVLPEETL